MGGSGVGKRRRRVKAAEADEGDNEGEASAVRTIIRPETSEKSSTLGIE